MNKDKKPIRHIELEQIILEKVIMPDLDKTMCDYRKCFFYGDFERCYESGFEYCCFYRKREDRNDK